MITALELTRDSVAAGDDSDAPHRRQVRLDQPVGSVASVQASLAAIADEYLPSVAGPANWVAWSRRPLSVLSNSWTAAKPVWQFDDNVEHLDAADGVLRLHFVYLAMIDPDIAFDIMWRLNSSIRTP